MGTSCRARIVSASVTNMCRVCLSRRSGGGLITTPSRHMRFSRHICLSTVSMSPDRRGCLTYCVARHACVSTTRNHHCACSVVYALVAPVIVAVAPQCRASYATTQQCRRNVVCVCVRCVCSWFDLVWVRLHRMCLGCCERFPRWCANVYSVVGVVLV